VTNRSSEGPGPGFGSAPSRGPAALARSPATLLVVILAVAAILRLFNLGGIPPGLWTDEVALGTNAYSLGTTGRSLDGKFLPLYVHEATFDTYGFPQIVYQPVYQYALIPFVKLFGRSAAVVRLPSVLFGVLGILAAYFLARDLFGSTIGLLTAGLLALSPWHHHYSRICFEVISLPVFTALGTACLFRGLTKPRFLFAGAGLLSLATYCYPPARLFVPLLLLGFVVTHYREVKAVRGATLDAALLGLVVALPNLYLVLSDPNQGRMFQLFIFSADLQGQKPIRFLEEWSGWTPWAGPILEHRALLLPFVFLYNWASHLSPGFLFLSGDDNPQFAVQGLGMCHLFMAPLLAVGLVELFRERRLPRNRFLIWWLLVWPIPASLTLFSPHGTRGMTNFPILEIISAIGLLTVARSARQVLGGAAPRTGKALLGGVASVLVLASAPFQVVSYLIHYHRDYPVYSAPAWTSGVAEGFQRLRELRRPGEEVYVASSVFNAYLNVLFFWDVDYRRLDPSRPSHEGLLPPGIHVTWPDRLPSPAPPSLWLVREEDLKDHPRARRLGEVRYPNGDPNLYLLRY
jgi:4-amino-4-deoxy-L-arabinose transferase-like glycosyltransferase